MAGNPLARVDAWLYHLGDVNAARAEAIAATDADLVVTEWASYARKEAPYDAGMLDAMRGDDADRLIVSYLSIGEAEPYRYYWKQAWERDAPAWLGEVNPEWTDNIKVKYWKPAWQKIVFDYAERIVEAGFNGLYLDIVDAWEYWRRKGPEGIDHRQEMIDFVARLREVVEAKLADVDPDREFVVIGQNALTLLRQQAYLDQIDGVAKEDLRFYYEYGREKTFDALPNSETKFSLKLLKQAEKAGVESFVVEYIPEAHEKKAARLLAEEAAALKDAGIPLYVAEGRDLDTIAEAPTGGGGTGGGGKVERGSNTGDRMVGDGKADRLDGRGGDDKLLGRGGDDRLDGGGGNDLLEGEGGADRLRGQGGKDELFGGDGDDFLYGGGKADWLEGGAGRDRLDGGSGDDRLTGGAGEDIFVLGAKTRGQARDFTPGEDRIEASGEAELREVRKGVMVESDGGGRLLLRGLGLGELDADTLFV
ncbi:endo alpha-1,4 polygalactosaminidase [Albimonas sp. CAU 1670]|uniref:MJ1477/TM1410 family putative glycoside hydrolase n=1 Tax=Albimonas sp. CAU 1670 TaxID=3032599 RepID=UPI0023DC57B4|nr:MJ1477/TM1410 family putative glycoside hydrolase [Albimonas sp. CAU 1670]MDF2232862.1 endo alpha-1,4 polygalactosaminidase [Albimonas sp. CAU 1670]